MLFIEMVVFYVAIAAWTMATCDGRGMPERHCLIGGLLWPITLLCLTVDLTVAMLSRAWGKGGQRPWSTGSSKPSRS